MKRLTVILLIALVALSGCKAIKKLGQFYVDYNTQAVFPANLHVALQGRMPGLEVTPLTLWLRLPFQAVLMAGVWWVALKQDGDVRTER